MAVLAEARVDEIERGLEAATAPVDYVELRATETGLVMLRGRIGGDGDRFNLGEATVTRAAVQIASGRGRLRLYPRARPEEGPIVRRLRRAVAKQEIS